MLNCKVKLFFAAVAAAPLIATPSFAGPSQDASSYASNPVVRSDGKVLGADPDIGIRFQLLRDDYANEW